MGDNDLQLFHKQIKAAGVLIAIGIVFGDIGTSPLYTYDGIFDAGEIINRTKALGVLSCVFWTLTLQTTFKYIFITLQADNHGEGGIFSLYALIRRYYGKWCVVLAIIGGSFLIADGIITPPISVASAIEGLQKFYPHLDTVPIVIVILIFLFVIQQFGTQQIGKFFGPVMVVWFTFIGVIGFMALRKDFSVLKGLNPYYAYQLLVHYPQGFWLLGGIFLCTTGAEALYSDMGHVGRNNIRISWVYIKIALILSYAGQTAWLLHVGKANSLSPFYNIIPEAIYIPSVILSSLATIIASQALISGCFTLVNEAINLGLWPRNRVVFPSAIKGQLYVPFFNWGLMAACILAVLYFRESRNMEAAFGLSVTLTMLVTTCLMILYLRIRRRPVLLIIGLAGIFLTVELSFLVANLQKVKEGGWIMLVIGTLLTIIMLVWEKGRDLQKRLSQKTAMTPALVQKFIDLSNDKTVRLYADNLICFTSVANVSEIETRILNSIFHTPVKKADVYWLMRINVTDDPYTMNYRVETIARNDIYKVSIELGFRIEPRVDLFFRNIICDLVESGDLSYDQSEDRRYNDNIVGNYRFVLFNSFLSYDNQLPFWKNFILRSYYNLKHISVRDDIKFGLDTNNVVFEKYPLVFASAEKVRLERLS